MPVQGLLIDLDGVLYEGTRVLPGAPEALARLRAAGRPYRFLTNTTMQSRRALAQKMQWMGFAVQPEEVFTAAAATARYLLAQPARRSLLLIADEAREDFAGLPEDNQHPDFVVVGDLEHGFTYELLNRAFRCLVGGAQLIAVQKNRCWMREDGLALDAGPWVALLEYASRQEARVIGKPSPDFFRLALDDLGLPPGEVLMVGDDPEFDLAPAKRLGLTTVLVKTGRMSGLAALPTVDPPPDRVVADFPALVSDLL
jgi:phospholysine phosphohistidine inorganic pyrophosphate phosphatase